MALSDLYFETMANACKESPLAYITDCLKSFYKLGHADGKSEAVFATETNPAAKVVGVCLTCHQDVKHVCPNASTEAEVPQILSVDPAYRVVADESHACFACKKPTRYDIVHTATDTAISQSFEGGEEAKEAADDLCEQLNRAVELEREQQRARRKVWTPLELAVISDQAGNKNVSMAVFEAIAQKLNEECA